MPKLTVKERFGAYVREYRVARGLTLVQLAWHANLSTDTMALIEAGQYDPDLDEVDRIAKALDVPLGTMLDHLSDEDEAPAVITEPSPLSMLGVLRSIRRWLEKR